MIPKMLWPINLVDDGYFILNTHSSFYVLKKTFQKQRSSFVVKVNVYTFVYFSLECYGGNCTRVVRLSAVKVRRPKCSIGTVFSQRKVYGWISLRSLITSNFFFHTYVFHIFWIFHLKNKTWLHAVVLNTKPIIHMTLLLANSDHRGNTIAGAFKRK